LGDPRKVVEKLRGMGYEVREVSDGGRLYGWVVKVGDRYIALSSGAKVYRSDAGDYVMMELPDEGIARNFLVGRYWGSVWGDPDYVRRAAGAAYYEKQLDRWMREELGKAGYTVERIDWGPNAAVPGFTYIIKDKDGNKIGEVQVAKIGDKYHLINTGLPPGVLASNDPRRAAAYFVYRHETGDENVAWRLAVGDERAKELYVSKAQYESEMEAREKWFKELTQRGLRPIMYAKIDGRPVVSENDLFLDEKTGVMYRTVLERQGNKITLKLVPASERDVRLAAVRGLEPQGFKVIDDKTVEKEGIRYRVYVEERDGKKTLRLEPYPEDVKKAALREAWWELWRQGYVRRGDYAVKDGVRYKVEVEEQGGRYVVKLTPVGPAAPGEEPRRYRSGDRRGSLETMRQIQFAIEKLGLEKELKPEDLRFGVGGRPRDVPYVPVLDEVSFGALGVPASQLLGSPAARELYWRYSTATLPGPRVQGFTLPERQSLERAAELQRIYGEKFSDVWTPLTFRAPTSSDINWRTALATGAEVFTFWIPTVKGVSALAASRGLRIPVLTTERTVTAGRGVRLPSLPGDFFEIHYVEPRRPPGSFTAAFVGQGVGEGAAVRGTPGNWQAVFARSAGQPAPGWAFEFASMTYRDVADWLKRLPSLGLRTELKPRVMRFTEVRGFAREYKPPRFEPPRVEPPTREPPGREVKVEWGGGKEAPIRETPTREAPRSETPGSEVRSGRGAPKGEAGLETREAGGGGVRTVAKVAQVEEELVGSVRGEVPVTSVKVAGKGEVGLETHRIPGEAPVVAPIKAAEVPAVRAPVLEVYEVTWPVEVPFREVGFVYLPDVRIRDFATPLTYPFELRTFEAPSASVSELETEREVETPTTRVAELPRYGTRVAEYGGGREGGFPTPPPPAPPRYVRGGYGGGGGSGYMAHRPARFLRRGWRVFEVLRI